jgi:hypothetical protein
MQTNLEGGFKITSAAQCIVCKTDEGKWIFEVIEVTDFTMIEMMGVEITDYKNIQAAIANFKGMGIDLGDIVQKELEELMKEYTVEQFVLEQTGISLKYNNKINHLNIINKKQQAFNMSERTT